MLIQPLGDATAISTAPRAATARATQAGAFEAVFARISGGTPQETPAASDESVQEDETVQAGPDSEAQADDSATAQDESDAQSAPQVARAVSQTSPEVVGAAFQNADSRGTLTDGHKDGAMADVKAAAETEKPQAARTTESPRLWAVTPGSAAAAAAVAHQFQAAASHGAGQVAGKAATAPNAPLAVEATPAGAQQPVQPRGMISGPAALTAAQGQAGATPNGIPPEFTARMSLLSTPSSDSTARVQGDAARLPGTGVFNTPWSTTRPEQPAAPAMVAPVLGARFAAAFGPAAARSETAESSSRLTPAAAAAQTSDATAQINPTTAPAMPQPFASVTQPAGFDPLAGNPERAGGISESLQALGGSAAVDAPTATGAAASMTSATQPDLARAIAQQIGAQITANSKTQLEIALSPAELGRVEIVIQDSENRLTLMITAERPETMDLIRRHLNLLAEEMRQMGFGGLSLQLGGEEGHTPRGESSAGSAQSLRENTPPDAAPAASAPALVARGTGLEQLDLRL